MQHVGNCGVMLSGLLGIMVHHGNPWVHLDLPLGSRHGKLLKSERQEAVEHTLLSSVPLLGCTVSIELPEMGCWRCFQIIGNHRS